ncbi:MAG: M48 family metalloprotease [Cytophagales bacterium]|nr:M48 family metalloprotease [Cytophagales bacterium]
MFRSGKVRLLIALAIALFSVISYYNKRQDNPKYGGQHPDPQAQAVVDKIGQKLVATLPAGQPYRFEFHLLSDPQTINAFALPGGQIFITYALYNKLQSEDQLAGVLGHEIGHVVERHSAQQIAKQQLTQGLTGAAVIASYDPDNPTGSVGKAAMAALIGNLVNMKYGRGDELESDRRGIEYMTKAGYNPEGMVGVMEVLAAAGGGSSRPEFFSTHPNQRFLLKIEAA